MIYMFSLCIALFWTHYAEAYYCEFNICETDQYCCAYNKCCSKLTDLWYFWVGIVLVVLLVLLLIFFKFYRNRRKSLNNPYILLTTT